MAPISESLDRQMQSNRTSLGIEYHRLSEIKLEPTPLIEQWTMVLCSAAAWLESLGYVHGDIRPSNLLPDENDHPKLADFDCATQIGEPCARAAPPWARILGSEAGADKGSFGTSGARTEQFAIGSIM